MGPGRRREGRAEGKFQDRGHQQRRSGLRRPDTQRRAEGPPRARLGIGAPTAAPHQPPAQPVTRSVTRSRPRPPVRAARATVSADQPWTAPRAAPRLPAALPSPRRPTRSAARPRTAAPASPPQSLPTPFLCCWTFGGGEGERGKVERRGPRDPRGDRGAGSDRRPSPCRPRAPRCLGLGPAASAAPGLLLRRELAGAAHSSTGRCAAHPARAAAARSSVRRTRPLAVRARPRTRPLPARARGR